MVADVQNGDSAPPLLAKTVVDQGPSLACKRAVANARYRTLDVLDRNPLL